MVAGMHHHDIARLDAQTRFTLPFLEMGRGIDLVITNTQPLQVHHNSRPYQLVQGNTANILPIGNKVERRVKMSTHVQRRCDMLPTHFVKSHALDPLDRRAFVGSETGRMHVPVLR